VIVLTRRKPQNDQEIRWDIRRGLKDRRPLKDVDAVLNFVGEPLAARPWTPARRKLLLESRIRPTERLVRDLQMAGATPKVLVGPGSLGFYGDRGEEVLDETLAAGTGFLAELSSTWEEAHLEAATQLGARGAVLRMFMALDAEGGALPLLASPFRYGLGGYVGSGEQFTPWISLRDAVRAFLFLVDGEGHGVFNGTVPHPVRNKAWCSALGTALGKPAKVQAPRWAVRGALGELGDAVFVASIRAVPRRLVEAGFAFEDTDIEETFQGLFHPEG